MTAVIEDPQSRVPEPDGNIDPDQPSHVWYAIQEGFLLACLEHWGVDGVDRVLFELYQLGLQEESWVALMLAQGETE